MANSLRSLYGSDVLIAPSYSFTGSLLNADYTEKMVGNLSYGYLWWITDKEKHNFAAIGDGGNVIYVNSENRIVVGVAGTFKPRIFDRVDFIEKKLLPLVAKI